MYLLNLISKKRKEVGNLKTIIYCVISLFYPIYRKLYLELICHSFSQKSEDILIDRNLGFPKNGFYVDIGANDPSFLNNTKRFYDRGWSGINIEPNHKKYSKLCEFRRRDINLNIALADCPEGFIYFNVFNSDAASTACKEQVEENIGSSLNRVGVVEGRCPPSPLGFIAFVPIRQNLR